MAKKKKLKVDPTVVKEMGEEWEIEVGETSFIGGKGLNMQAMGYPCGVCASKATKLNYARGTDEEESQLIWIELVCKECKSYTMYTRK